MIHWLLVAYIGGVVKNREIRIPLWRRGYLPMSLVVLVLKVIIERQEDPGVHSRVSSVWLRLGLAFNFL